MAHVWVTLTIIAFFALCWALVIGCDRIIGPDDESDLPVVDAGETADNETAHDEAAGAAR